MSLGIYQQDINPVYTFSFTLPRRSIPVANSEGRKSKNSKIKDFTTASSYPIISVNVKQHVLFTKNKYIESMCDKQDSKAATIRGSFRTRNKFIIARNLLCRLVKYEKALTSIEVSKVVSLVCIPPIIYITNCQPHFE